MTSYNFSYTSFLAYTIKLRTKGQTSHSKNPKLKNDMP